MGRFFKAEAKQLSKFKVGVRTCGSHVPSAAAFAAPYAAGRIGSPVLPVVRQRALVTFNLPRHVTACLAEERPGEETAGEVAAAEAADAAHRAGSDGQGAMIAALAAAEERFNERQPGDAAAGELWGRDDHDAASCRTERKLLSQQMRQAVAEERQAGGVAGAARRTLEARGQGVWNAGKNRRTGSRQVVQREPAQRHVMRLRCSRKLGRMESESLTISDALAAAEERINER